jgi:hypothetical protein
MKCYLIVLTRASDGAIKTPCLVYDECERDAFFSPNKEMAERFITELREWHPRASYKLVEVAI